jgi:hypothetical protein
MHVKWRYGTLAPERLFHVRFRGHTAVALMGSAIGIGVRMRRLAVLGAAVAAMMAAVAATVAAVAVMATAVAVTVVSTAAASTASAPTWSLQATPGPSGPPDAALTSVSCPSASDCMAVGASDFGFDHLGINLLAPIATFAERWDGSAWTVLPTPAAGSSPGLVSVSCPSATFCVAVGSTKSAGRGTVGVVSGGRNPHALLEMWNGSAWTVRPTPLGSVSNSRLSGVSCVSSRFCIAVGAFEKSWGLIWNGSIWRRITPPAVNYDASLNAVDCVAVNDCTAVGSYNVNKSGVADLRPLAAHWSGARWTVSKPPGERDVYHGKPYTDFTWLTGVSCASRRSCLATGLAQRTQNFYPQGGFADRWDGRRWTAATAGIARNSPLNGVSCVAADDCYAAGQYDPRTITPPATQRPLLEHWASGHWSQVPLPAVATLPNRVWFAGNLLDPNLYGIACVPQAGCVAVGAQPQGAASAPLALTDLPAPASG